MQLTFCLELFHQLTSREKLYKTLVLKWYFLSLIGTNINVIKLLSALISISANAEMYHTGYLFMAALPWHVVYMDWSMHGQLSIEAYGQLSMLWTIVHRYGQLSIAMENCPQVIKLSIIVHSMDNLWKIFENMDNYP